MPSHRAGGKFGGDHTTVIGVAEPVVDEAQQIPQVSKIVLGIIKHIGNGRTGIKFKPIQSGLKAVIRGNGCIQKIYFYTSEPATAQQQLQQAFHNGK